MPDSLDTLVLKPDSNCFAGDLVEVIDAANIKHSLNVPKGAIASVGFIRFLETTTKVNASKGLISSGVLDRQIEAQATVLLEIQFCPLYDGV